MNKESGKGSNKIHVRKPMMSKAGVVFEKQLLLGSSAPVRKSDSEAGSKQISFNPIKYQSRHRHGSFSPFRTVPRSSRDSYLLRVTKEPNVRTNYELNFSPVLQSSPKYSLFRSQFQRRISYDYETRDRSMEQPPVEISSVPKKCQHSMDMTDVKRPLTVNDCMDWRKTYHQFDFAKQTMYKNEAETALPEDYMNRTLEEVATTRESHFNNMRRFSTKVRANKAHPFDSDSPHKYLDLQKEERVPVFDLQKTNWSRLKKMWDGNRANLDFSKFREKVIVKLDRSEPAWNPKLEYTPKLEAIKQRVYKTFDISKDLDREPNQYPNKYPMKLSQRIDYGMNYYPELRDISSVRRKRSVNLI